MDIRIAWENGQHETCSWESFAAENADAYGAEELAEINAALEAGEEWYGGGGAAPIFGISRAAGDACDHDWEFVRDWYGDPEVIHGTADCSFLRCRKCGEKKPATYEDHRDYEDARHEL